MRLLDDVQRTRTKLGSYESCQNPQLHRYTYHLILEDGSLRDSGYDTGYCFC